MKDCRLSNPVCNFCGRNSYIEAVFITKQKSSNVKHSCKKTVNTTTESSPFVAVTINNWKIPFLVDTGASCKLISRSTWKNVGMLRPQKDKARLLKSASMTSF